MKKYSLFIADIFTEHIRMVIYNY